MARTSRSQSLIALFLWRVITSGLVSHGFLYNGAEQILQDMRDVVLNTTLVIAHPPEDGEVGSQFETHIQMVTTDVEKFSKVFNNSFICVQLDAMPYACWPVLTSRIRFADVPDGIHTVSLYGKKRKNKQLKRHLMKAIAFLVFALPYRWRLVCITSTAPSPSRSRLQGSGASGVGLMHR